MKGFRRVAAGLAALLLIVGGGVELRARMAFSGPGDGGPAQGRRGLASLEERAREQAGRIGAALPRAGTEAAEAAPGDAAPHPFTGFAAPGERDRLAAAQALLASAREASASPADPGPRCALLLGGAGADDFATGGGAALGEALADGDAQALEWLRFDEPRFKQPQQLTLLLHLFGQGLRPDLVIDYQGFNECALGADNARRGVHPTYPAHGPWLALHAESPAEAQFAQRERMERLLAFAGRVARQRARFATRSEMLAERSRRNLEREWIDLSGGMPPAYLEAQLASEPGGHLLGPEFNGDDDALIATIAEHWERSVLAAHAACEVRGVLYVALLQPLDFEGVQLEGDLSGERRAFCERCYLALRQRGARLAAAGVTFVDGTELLGDTTSLDGARLAPEGAARLGRSLGMKIAAELRSMERERPR